MEVESGSVTHASPAQLRTLRLSPDTSSRLFLRDHPWYGKPLGANPVVGDLSGARSLYVIDFEAERVAGDFGTDFAVAERGVERLDGAEYFMVSSFLDRRHDRHPPARRRQRWKKERLSAKDRRLRLVAKTK